MAKKEKRTKADQYSDILEPNGKQLKDCHVLGFCFENETRQHVFHFYLMESDIKYLIYDGMDKKTNVVLFPYKTNEQDLRKLAERLGGKEYNPDLKAKI